MAAIAWETLFGQCALSRQLTKENSLLRMSHFDSHARRLFIACSNVIEHFQKTAKASVVVV
jgi:hypothetical protein